MAAINQAELGFNCRWPLIFAAAGIMTVVSVFLHDPSKLHPWMFPRTIWAGADYEFPRQTDRRDGVSLLPMFCVHMYVRLCLKLVRYDNWQHNLTAICTSRYC